MISGNPFLRFCPYLLLTFVCSSAVVRAQGVPPGGPTSLPIDHTFLTQENGWMVLGDGAKISLAANPISLGIAHGALRLDYTVSQGAFSAFGLPIGNPVLTQANSFRLSILSDYATTMVYGMQEENGGRYLAFFAVPKNKWQLVELSPSDFKLSDGPNDPKDPDNKLDLDKIAFLGLVDAAQVLPLMDDPTVSGLFNVKPGPHVLYLADFQVSAAKLPGSRSGSASADVIDDFSHPQVDWITFGGVTATTYTRTSQRGRGLQLSYKQSPGKPAGMLKMLGHGQIAGANKVNLTLASEKPANLIIRIEQTDGQKFNAKANIPAGTSAPTVISLAFADFKPADDAKDPHAALDVNSASHLLIVDATGLAGGVTQDTDNTLYIGDIHIER